MSAKRREKPAYRGPAELVALADAEKVYTIFSVQPETLKAWNEEGWLPLFYPRGKGPGKPVYAPVMKVREAIEKRSA